MLGGDWSWVSLAARYYIQAIRALPDGATQAPARPNTDSEDTDRSGGERTELP
jgi:hypothetical protein